MAWIEQFNREQCEVAEESSLGIREQEITDAKDDLMETIVDIARNRAVDSLMTCPFCGGIDTQPYPEANLQVSTDDYYFCGDCEGRWWRESEIEH